jgi:putative phosphoribosyl transferase
MTGEALRNVRAPTLLLVGGADPEVLELNRTALARLPERAAVWFTTYLVRR